MSNPNGDRIAALSRQTGSPEAVAVGVIAGHYLHLAQRRAEDDAALVTLNYAHTWADLLTETKDDLGEADRGFLHALSETILPKGDDGEYTHPLMRLLVAVARRETDNPNPTPAFGSRR